MCAPVLRLQVAKLPIKVGDNVTIVCRVCGRKNIFWFKDNGRFGETKRVKWINTKKVSTNPYVVEGRLWIKRVKKRDRGVFTCYALDFFTNIAEKGHINLAGKCEISCDILCMLYLTCFCFQFVPMSIP